MHNTYTPIGQPPDAALPTRTVSSSSTPLRQISSGWEDSDDEVAEGSFCGNAPQQRWNFEDVVMEERHVLNTKKESRQQGTASARAPPRVPFSVAFSGGGVRAAAFQAGVLWRLAQEDRLQDVEYMVAVSGGAYAAASFASHCQAANPCAGSAQKGLQRNDWKSDVAGIPTGASSTSPEEVAAWYRRVVAKTVCRMQQNIGYLLRDAVQDPCAGREDGSSMLPRICDLPLLILELFFVLLINPLMVFVIAVVPACEVWDILFGAAMRAAYCMPIRADAWTIMSEWSFLYDFVNGLLWSILVTFLVWALTKLVPGCRKPSRSKADAGLRKNTKLYLFARTLRAVLVRICICMLVVSGLCYFVVGIQLWSSDVSEATYQQRGELCRRYASERSASGIAPRCGDVVRGPFNHQPWYELLNLTEVWAEAENQTAASRRPWGWTLESLRPAENRSSVLFSNQGIAASVSRSLPNLHNLWHRLHRIIYQAVSSVLAWSSLLLLIMLVVAVVLVPFHRGFFFFALFLVLPLVVFVSFAGLVQYRVYGPITGQALLRHWLPFSHEHWNSFVGRSLAFSFPAMVIFHVANSAWHKYHCRSLQLAFFHNGKDTKWKDLEANPFCPFLIFTGLLTDFKTPGTKKGDLDSVSEIYFSSLHVGGEVAGYIPAPPFQSLAKITALGAAAPDALIFGSPQRIQSLQYRNLLAPFMACAWGDYIFFQQRRPWWFLQPIRRFAEDTGTEYEILWLLYRLPASLVWATVLVFLLCGHRMAERSACQAAVNYFIIAVDVFAVMVILSFFSYEPLLEFLMFSPVIRNIQMMSNFHFQAERPPSLIYIADGGLRDCTGILPLIMRKCARILLVLAANDPQDELQVLRAALDLAMSQRLASFYDPRDPRRDIRLIFEEFKRESEMRYLHIGIRYGWMQEGEKPETGHLFVVKNRLPASLADKPMEPLLTEEELLGDMDSMSDSEQSDWSNHGLRQTDLGGCWCDCCHTHGCNFGSKFPHLSNLAYVFLTPQLFSSLCRLGHEISKEVVDVIAQSEKPERPWEAVVDRSISSS